MQYLIYLIFRWTAFLFSLIPFRVVYMISDMAYLVVYHLVRYRRAIVYRNLKNSFPEKTEAEIAEVTRKFYHHFCDVMLESIKVYTMPDKEVVKRYLMKDSAELDRFAEDGRPGICVAGHYNNWEWGGIASESQIRHRGIGFYKPLSNHYIDAFVAKNRARGRNRVASIEQTHQTFKQYEDYPSLFLMIADQSPPQPRMVHWVTFMNQETAVLTGPERYARMFDYPVFYAHVVKLKRGYYDLQFILLCEHPKDAKAGEITAKYMNALETQIRENPAYYLWSHRRWKHKRPAGNPETRKTKD